MQPLWGPVRLQDCRDSISHTSPGCCDAGQLQAFPGSFTIARCLGNIVEAVKNQGVAGRLTPRLEVVLFLPVLREPLAV